MSFDASDRPHQLGSPDILLLGGSHKLEALTLVLFFRAAFPFFPGSLFFGKPSKTQEKQIRLLKRTSCKEWERHQPLELYILLLASVFYHDKVTPFSGGLKGNHRFPLLTLITPRNRPNIKTPAFWLGEPVAVGQKSARPSHRSQNHQLL